MSPSSIFLASYALSAAAGLATLLRSGQKLTWLNVASSVLNSGLLGLAICLIWYVRFQENLYFLVGLCLLSGLGGVASIDFVLSALRKGGFNVQIGKDGGVKLSEEKKKDE